MSKLLQILPIGAPDPELTEWLRAQLAEGFDVYAEILDTALDPAFAFHPERGQYHSSEILARMASFVTRKTWRLLALSEVDLYIPILTFVFGEAQIGGPSAVVSYHRLRQEFYGLPEDRNLLARRLLTESIHELGHTLDLVHCSDYRCVMASSHSVEWIDIKEFTFCPDCAARANH